MTLQTIFALLVLAAILYLAFVIGAIVLRILLGLLAIGLAIWLVLQILNRP